LGNLPEASLKKDSTLANLLRIFMAIRKEERESIRSSFLHVVSGILKYYEKENDECQSPIYETPS
jgi:hypothetical protein